MNAAPVASSPTKRVKVRMSKDSTRILKLVSELNNKPVVVTAKPSKRVKLITTPPRVFRDFSSRVYILVEEKRNHNRYITIRNDEVDVVRLDHELPARDPKTGFLVTQETTSTTELKPLTDKGGNPYDFKLAAQRLYEGIVPRTYNATKELCVILDKPIPPLPEEVQQARRIAGERLKQARAAKSSNDEGNNNPPTKKGNTMSQQDAATVVFEVKNNTAKRGFLLEYVNKAAALEQFTRDKLVSKVVGKACDEDRAIRYFAWCTAHGIFGEAAKAKAATKKSAKLVKKNGKAAGKAK